jgi:hypothetical protein
VRTWRFTLAAACIVVTCASQAGAAPVADGRITGSVAPTLRPTSGTESVALAIDASNLTIADVASVGRSGAFKLTVPPGVYLVATEKTARSAATAVGYSRLVRVRSGKGVSPPRIARRPQSAVRGGLVNGKVVVAVKEFSTSPRAVEGGGLASMVQTDLHRAGGSCIVVADWMRRGDILAEIRLQQRRDFDPSTRVTPHLLRPDVFVEGSVSPTVSSISWNIRMRNARTGRIVARDSGTVPRARYLDVSLDIARRLLEQLDAECLPTLIVGAFSGELKVGATTTFTGKIRFERIVPPPTKGLAEYRVAGVEFTTTIDGRPACQGSATEKVTLSNLDARLSKLVIDPNAVQGKFRYFVVSMFQSPNQRQITLTCNGAPVTTPWIPAAALNTGSNQFSDGVTFKGTNAELKPNVYRWDLQSVG